MSWKVRLPRTVVYVAVVLLLSVTFGCGPSALGGDHNRPAEAAAAPTTTASSSGENPGINLQCAANQIRNAPAPFHWLYEKEVVGLSDADWEADVAHDFIAGTFIDSSGAHAIHGTRSDSTSWNTAVMTLVEPLPASAFALVNNSSAIVRAGNQSMNGQNTVKYKIDTTEDTQGDASLIHNVLGAGGFVKGTAWVNAQGCPVKFVLNVEQHNNDGSVEKEHYEANVTLP